mmetsp:Transcript_10620/g.23580  ORF Transcript_10620/g.23580 Transcript_10620/m.23580 type:complete len:231 (-) Transcript_10620:967-1659(-)
MRQHRIDRSAINDFTLTQQDELIKVGNRFGWRLQQTHNRGDVFNAGDLTHELGNVVGGGGIQARRNLVAAQNGRIDAKHFSHGDALLFSSTHTTNSRLISHKCIFDACQPQTLHDLLYCFLFLVHFFNNGIHLWSFLEPWFSMCATTAAFPSKFASFLDGQPRMKPINLVNVANQVAPNDRVSLLLARVLDSKWSDAVDAHRSALGFSLLIREVVGNHLEQCGFSTSWST